MGGKTTKYRLSIPIQQETKQLLDRLAKAKASSAGATAGQFLDAMRPQLEQLVEVMEQAASDPAGALQRLGAFADAATDELARVRQEAEGERASLPESGAPAARGKPPSTCTPTERFYQIQDRATGEFWCLGIAWPGDAADEALEKARKADSGAEWVLREV